MMKTILKPEMKLVQQGEKLKVYSINAIGGMQLPPHSSTSEVVLIAQAGEATLKIGEKDIELKAGCYNVIPANATHSLVIHTDFKAMVIMVKNADVKFE